MAVRNVLQIGDPKLKAENQIIVFPRDIEIVKEVVQDLTDTMRESGLIGMAAPQIGVNLKIFVTEPRETELRPADQSDVLRVFINPEIIELSDTKTVLYEGCGSVASANLFGPVERPKEITVKACDLEGKEFTFQADGLLGRAIQHEYDHLVGIEFTEKIQDYTKLMTREHYIERIKNSKPQLENSKITTKIFKYSPL